METPEKYAFTLTEILLAVVIVGVIAALVLPAVVTKYQNHTFDLAYKREVNTISDLIDQLAVDEHKTNFHNTIMFLDEEPESYNSSSGAFIKKYLKVSRFCGDNKTNCFGSKYYTIENRTKKEYTFTPKGSCALLKNGMSICISPQIGNSVIEGWIDLNGKKGPNVFNHDLRQFSIDLQNRTAFNDGTKKIKLYCEENPDSAACPKKNEEETPEEPSVDECPNAPTVRGDAYWTKCCPETRYASLEICQLEVNPEDECPTMPTSKTDAYGQKCCSDSRYKATAPCNYKVKVATFQIQSGTDDYLSNCSPDTYYPNRHDYSTFFDHFASNAKGLEVDFKSNLLNETCTPKSDTGTDNCYRLTNDDLYNKRKYSSCYIQSLSANPQYMTYASITPKGANYTCQFNSYPQEIHYLSGHIGREETKLVGKYEYLTDHLGNFVEYTGRSSCYYWYGRGSNGCNDNPCGASGYLRGDRQLINYSWVDILE